MGGRRSKKKDRKPRVSIGTSQSQGAPPMAKNVTNSGTSQSQEIKNPRDSTEVENVKKVGSDQAELIVGSKERKPEDAAMANSGETPQSQEINDHKDSTEVENVKKVESSGSQQAAKDGSKERKPKDGSKERKPKDAALDSETPQSAMEMEMENNGGNVANSETPPSQETKNPRRDSTEAPPSQETKNPRRDSTEVENENVKKVGSDQAESGWSQQATFTAKDGSKERKPKDDAMEKNGANSETPQSTMENNGGNVANSETPQSQETKNHKDSTEVENVKKVGSDQAELGSQQAAFTLKDGSKGTKGNPCRQKGLKIEDVEEPSSDGKSKKARETTAEGKGKGVADISETKGSAPDDSDEPLSQFSKHFGYGYFDGRGSLVGDGCFYGVGTFQKTGKTGSQRSVTPQWFCGVGRFCGEGTSSGYGTLASLLEDELKQRESPTRNTMM